MEIRDGQIVSFGDSHMLVSIELGTGDIDLKFIDGPKFDTNVKYSIIDQQILIGRMPECTIKFDDNSLSRYQCCLSYQNSWLLEDGY